MEKRPTILNDFSSVVYATTANSSFIPHAITLDSALGRKTSWIVLEDKGRLLTASVFRESGSEPGCYSRDIYAWTGRKWAKPKKDRHKYRTVPAPPPDAFSTNLNGVEFWTVRDPTKMEIERLGSLIAVLSPSTNVVSIVAHSVIR
jgi:hypothetical protein